MAGERILSPRAFFDQARHIARWHHENWDGSGYPDHLDGNKIPLAARIVAVCDAYQAITTGRCYRPAQSPELARGELRGEAGGHFDPAVVDAFLSELESPTSPAASGSEPSPRRSPPRALAELSATGGEPSRTLSRGR